MSKQRIILPALVLILGPSILRPQRAGVIEGDVYLSHGPVSANVVRFIPADSVAAARRQICAEPVLRRRVDSLLAVVKDARATADSVRRAIKLGQFDQERAAAGARADSVAKVVGSQALSLLEIASEAFVARLARTSVAESRTGVNGHYRADSLAPGQYVLWVETQLGPARYYWLTVSTIQSAHKTVDLDNETATTGVLYCLTEVGR